MVEEDSPTKSRWEAAVCRTKRAYPLWRNPLKMPPMKQQTISHILFGLVWLIACGAATAQVQKCVTAGGKVEYRQGLCDAPAEHRYMQRGTVNTVDAMPDHEIARTLQPPPPPRYDSAAAYSDNDGGGRVPTAQEIKNMETSANSITVGRRERLVRQAEINAAKDRRAGGSGVVDLSAVNAFDDRAAQRRQAAAISAAASAARDAQQVQGVGRCNGPSCRGPDGSRHNMGNRRTVVGADGRVCRRVGDKLHCN